MCSILKQHSRIFYVRVQKLFIFFSCPEFNRPSPRFHRFHLVERKSHGTYFNTPWPSEVGRIFWRSKKFARARTGDVPGGVGA